MSLFVKSGRSAVSAACLECTEYGHVGAGRLVGTEGAADVTIRREELVDQGDEQAMPVENIIADGGRGVVTLCTGVLGREEFITAIRRRYEPVSELHARQYFLTDHSGVTKFAMSSQDIVDLTRITRAASLVNPNVHLASVVPGDLAFGMVRMWRSYAEQFVWSFRMCRSRAEAEQWLRDEIGPDLIFR
jgi:hypothetical protein